MVDYCDEERLEFEEYLDFLRRCDLGSQYPEHDFENRIRTLLTNVDISITARDQKGLLIGVCLGLTDFAYFLFLTDLGVDRDWVGKGIGTVLLSRAHQKAGGEDDITMTTISSENATGFYEARGLQSKSELVVKYCRRWKAFVVR